MIGGLEKMWAEFIMTYFMEISRDLYMEGTEENH
jgi:hypothetical protein